MKNTLFVAFFLVCAVSIFAVALVVSPVHAQKAKGQLNSFGNTGVVFDGSDGKRQGMDTKVNTSGGSVPNASPPSRVDTSTGTAGGYSVGTSTGTASGTTTTQKPKAGTEKAH